MANDFTAAQMLAMDGAELTLEAERAEARVVDSPGRTISREALDALVVEMGRWVGSRMLRAVNTGHMPQRVTVHLRVELDGKAAT
jgi:hypothetical protein